MGEAETPVFRVIGGAIGNPVRLIGQGMEMGTQRGERHCRIYWLTVLDDVEVVGREVYDARAILTRDVSVSDIPLTRHGPIKSRGSGRDLIELKRDMILKGRERL